MGFKRREFLTAIGATGLYMALPVAHAAPHSHINARPARLLAAWQLRNGDYQVGVVQLNPTASELISVQRAFDLPTRPHGLMHLHGDDYLVIARRPGDWMMRLNSASGATQRIWQEADRHLNGHSAQLGDLIYTTETDLLSGQGALGVRNLQTLELLDVWPTQGHDPHEMLVLPKGGLGISQPFLLVANGGIQTHADMGRTPLNTLPMDSSLVALDPFTGTVLKQWVLKDSRLSLRHLVQHRSGVVGIAMQAHHADSTQRMAAPVLALLNEKGLRVVDESAGVQGYTGDIAATTEGFVISCTKNDSAAQFNFQGKLLRTHVARSACALAALGQQVWLGHQLALASSAIELDNHWLVLSKPA